MTVQQPDFVQDVYGDLDRNYWTPKTIEEWSEVKKTNTILTSWENQQIQERELRKIFAIWTFVLISIQLLFIIVTILFHGYELITLNENIIKIFMPSAFFEIFGLGFLVMKYLFRLPNKEIIELFKN